MKFIYNKIFLEHDTGMHPENAKRLEAMGEIKENSLKADEKYVDLIHTKKYIEKVRNTKQGHLDNDTVVSEKSFEAAVKAVNATIMASKQGDFALVRPPGHHAHPDRSSGFCLFNNVAIATQRLVEQGKKVLLFDFDGHLGDGTEKIFYDTDKVLYWSLHQFPAFPGGGNVNEIGDKEGKGFTINVPLPPGSGDDIFMNSVDRFLPYAKKFSPDYVAVSAGFDAHQHDLLLQLKLSSNAFYKLGNMLRKEFSNVFATLEGGYNVETFPKLVNSFIEGFNGKELSFKENTTDSRIIAMDEIEAGCIQLEKNLKEYWE